MSELFAQVLSVFATPGGKAVLAMAALALVFLVVASFWTSLRMPRADRVESERLDTVPPPPIAPQLAGRSPRDGFSESGGGLVKPLLLGAIALAFAAVAGFAFRTIGLESAQERLASMRAVQEGANASDTALRSSGSGDLVIAALGHANPQQLCRTAGSLSERFVEVCERGAAVRLDILRLVHNGEPVLDPAWNNAAPTYVMASSHAAPFAFDAGTGFAAPETSRASGYDGYLVIGVAAPGEEAAAKARAEALRDFAIAELSGGHRADCLTRERVYAVSAAFDPASVDVLKQRRAEVAALSAAARHGHARDRAAAEDAADSLARAEAVLSEAPAPIIIGITADPMSSDTDRDMREAARSFLATYGDGLQLSSVSAIDAIDACARGEAKL